MIVKELIEKLQTLNPNAHIEIETDVYGEPEFAVEADVRATGTCVTLMSKAAAENKAIYVPAGMTTDEYNGEPKYGDPDYTLEFSDVAKEVAAHYGHHIPLTSHKPQ